MATGLGEGKLWIQTRPGKGWVLPGYLCPTFATWVMLLWPIQVREWERMQHWI